MEILGNEELGEEQIFFSFFFEFVPILEQISLLLLFATRINSSLQVYINIASCTMLTLLLLELILKCYFRQKKISMLSNKITEHQRYKTKFALF